MLNSRFDLYKKEWLDLVFNDRNKSYGAYDLRVHYGEYMFRAMALTLGLFVAAGMAVKVFIKPQDQNRYIIRDVNVVHPPHIVQPPKTKDNQVHEDVKNPRHTAVKPKPIVNVPTQKLVIVKPTNDPVKDPDLAAQNTITTVGQTNSKGTDQPQKTIIDSQPGTGETKAGDGEGTNDNTIHLGVDVMPEPTGGIAAWSKFLQRNIRYPDTDAEGKVYLSFVVEKDGHLSNITLIKGVSTLIDEEAMRVLKIAPAWKPGQQNGQPVRVKYTLPISFQMNQ